MSLAPGKSEELEGTVEELSWGGWGRVGGVIGLVLGEVVMERDLELLGCGDGERAY